MGRFRNADYQTVIGSNNSQGVLPYTPAQVGAAFDSTPGTITDASSDYASLPEAETMQGVSGRPNMSTRLRSRTGRTGLTYAPMVDPLGTQDGGQIGPTGGRNQGAANAPSRSVLDLADHGPWDANYADGRVPISPVPKHATWFGKWFGSFFTKRETHVVPALGRPTTQDDTAQTTFTTEQNTFTIPDLRRTFDTPSVAGVGTNNKGQAYVAKAGRPIQDAEFDPMTDRVENVRTKVLENSPPFLPDRTRAGAADPATQSRPAYMPHWFYFRPFDQNEAQHLAGVKGVVRNPLAGRPIATASEAQSEIAYVHTGQRGNLISSPAPGMSPSGPQPNTLRQTPSPWDSDLYSASDSAMSRRNFRGRG